MEKLTEFQIIGKVRTQIRKQYEKEHPNWEEEMDKKPLDRPNKNDYIDSLLREIDDCLEGM